MHKKVVPDKHLVTNSALLSSSESVIRNGYTEERSWRTSNEFAGDNNTLILLSCCPNSSSSAAQLRKEVELGPIMSFDSRPFSSESVCAYFDVVERQLLYRRLSNNGAQ